MITRQMMGRYQPYGLIPSKAASGTISQGARYYKVACV